MTTRLHITGNERADELLSTDANALLIGMVLDQQDRLEKAFAGPAVIAERLGGSFDVAAIAAMAEDDFVELCSRRPAVHRFPASMAKRIQQVCRVLVDDFDGRAENLWSAAGSGNEVRTAIGALPGFGAQKSSIFTALLGKQYGVTPPGWREAAGDYGKDGYRSVADIVDADSLVKVRTTKSEAKKAAKAAKADDA